jgi:hypothetical protein
MAKHLFTAFRVAAIPVLLSLVIMVESRLNFRLWHHLIDVLVFLLLADITSHLHGKLRDVLLVLTSLAFGFSVLEFGADIWGYTHAFPVFESGQLQVQRPFIGWGPEQAGRYHSLKTDRRTGATIYSVDYTIDRDLLRHTQSCETGPTIVFFGCSLTFGAGVNDSDTLPQAFADSLARKERVLNLGDLGYGPQQFLSQMQSGLFDPVIGSQPRLFVFLTAPWHAERTSCKWVGSNHAPRYMLENGQLVLKGLCREGFRLWLDERLEKYATYRKLIEPYRRVLSHEDVDLYVRIILAAIDLAKEKYGVPVVVLYMKVPPVYLRGAGFSDDAIIQRFKEGGAIVIDASLDKEKAEGAVIEIPGDGHPTPLANRIRAGILKDYLEQNMPGLLVSGRS